MGGSAVHKGPAEIKFGPENVSSYFYIAAYCQTKVTCLGSSHFMATAIVYLNPIRVLLFTVILYSYNNVTGQ